MIFVNNAIGETIYHDESWLDLTGQAPHEAMGTAWLERVYGEDRALVEDTHFRAIETTREYGMVYRLLAPDDSVRWVSVGARPSFGPPDGTFLGYLGSLLVLPCEIGVVGASAHIHADVTTAPRPVAADDRGPGQPHPGRAGAGSPPDGLRCRIADALAHSRAARTRLGSAGAHRTRALLDMALIALDKELSVVANGR